MHLTTLRAEECTPALQQQIIELCTRAYEEDFEGYAANLPDPTHVLAFEGERLVSHACWVTRWLQVGDGSFFRTAYIEAVATDPLFQRRGYATAVMRQIAKAIQAFDLAALSPSDPAFYTPFGWESWRGPLSTRTDQGVVPTPDEEIMVMRLPATPPLDFDAPASIEWRAGEVW